MRYANLRLALVVVLMLGTTAFLRSRSGPESLPPRTSLDDFPDRLGEWHSRQIYISEDIQKILGHGDFMQRIFSRPEGARTEAVELFIAYFPSQRTGSTIHSPKNCLPGSGWVPVESHRIPLTRPDGTVVTVNRYVIQKGNVRQLVIYWYQAHDRVVASEYWAKFYMVADAFSLNRTDGSLVRLITRLDPSESAEDGQQRIVSFLSNLFPILSEYIPR